MEEIEKTQITAEAVRPLLEIGVAAFTLPGQSESGDRHIIAPFAGGMVVAAVDGIGHGAEAAKVARIAQEVVRSYPAEALTLLIKRCHEELRGTRGVVMSIAAFNYAEKVMTWAGVGNVQGTLLSLDRHSQPHTLLVSMGTLGQQLGAVYPAKLPLRSGDTLIFSTDGVREDFSQRLNLKLSPQQLADDILARTVRHTDDALVLAARFLV